MRQLPTLPAGVLALALGVIGLAATPNDPVSAPPAKSRELRLQVMESPNVIPGVKPPSRLYVADLYNNSAAPVVLEVVQMPGGYVGSGRFYACSLESWDPQKQKWDALRPARLADFGLRPQVKETRLPLSERTEVCRMILPSQGGSLGGCVRFSLRLRWDDDQRVPIVSLPFSIDVAPGTVKGGAGCASSSVHQ